MSIYRYSEWDGSQEVFNLDAGRLMDELGRRLMSDGDISRVLRAMQNSGMTDHQGRQSPSLQSMLERLRRIKQAQLEKYNLGSIMDQVRQKLDNVLKTEREGIQQQLTGVRERAARADSGKLAPELAQKLLQTMENRAAQNLDKLDHLPKDTGGQLRELTQYDFMDSEARHQFQELLDMLKKNAVQSYARDLAQMVKNMDASSLASIRHMTEAINQMLEQRLRGEEPDFAGFMQQFGNLFGEEPPQNLDELIERLQQQMAQARALLESLSPEDRQALQEALRSVLDEGTSYELAKLAMNLAALSPSEGLPEGYPFSGEESVSYDQALKLMETLQKLDGLEDQLKDSQLDQSLDGIDEKLLKEVMGNEALQELDALRRMARILEEAGYIRKNRDRYELTPRGIRKIGEGALRDIFAHLKKDRVGGHNLKSLGTGGDPTGETKLYEFGDDFDIHLQKTIMNSLLREAEPPPVRLKVQDFEMLRKEEVTRSAIVLIIDVSLSMSLRGHLQAAKRTAIALDSLIRGQFPKDRLHIVGFSRSAKVIDKEELVYITSNYFDHGTNLQQALCLARRLLSKETCSNKEVILISDGEPTAHVEDDDIVFQYPPSLRTLQLTLREVRNCTQQKIVINTFMLDSSSFLRDFVSQMTRLNKGRVFFTSANSLGKYVLVDYVSRKKKAIG